MRSDLATIERVFGERVEAERKSPTPTRAAVAEAAETVTVGAFEVRDPKRSERALAKGVEDRVKQLQDYLTDVASLHAKLQSLKVKPIAILPLAAWRKCCIESGLFFCKQRQVSLLLHGLRSDIENMGSRHPLEIVNRLKGRFTPQQLVAKMAQQGHTLGEHRGGPHLVVDIRLPDPPADVVDMLLKVQHLRPQTVAEVSAITFTPSLDWILERAVLEMISAAPSRAIMPNGQLPPRSDAEARDMGYASYDDWRRRCPIISVEHNLANAVVAQFGDFPIEKAVVEKAAAGDIFDPIIERASPEVDDERPFEDPDLREIVSASSALEITAEMARREFQAIRMAMELGVPPHDGNVMDAVRKAIRERMPTSRLRRMIGLS